MNYMEYLNLRKDRRKICIFGAGALGGGDGYLFLKNMLDSKQKISFFCDNHICEGTEIVDGIKTVNPEYLYGHREDIVCIITVKKAIQEEIKKQLDRNGINEYYTLNADDIFMICNKVVQEGKKEEILKVQSFFKARKYEFQIETSSFCNAKCVFCPNPSLKRKKNIMSQNVFKKIINQIKEENIKVSRFILCLNGEPLTDPDLFVRIKQLKADFPESQVEFTSNFAMAGKEIVEKIFESGLDKIVCSLNSVDASEYKEIMGIDFEVTLRNIEYLLRRKEERKSNLEVCLSIVQTSKNEDMVNRFKERFGKDAKIRVIRLGQWIDKELPQDICISKREGVCPILYRTVNILSNGDFALCCFDAEGMTGKNIMDTTIRGGWGSKVLEDMRKWHLINGKTNKECRYCSF